MRSRLTSLSLCVLLLVGPMVRAGGWDACARAELLLSGVSAQDAQALLAQARGQGLDVSLSGSSDGLAISVRAGDGLSLEAALAALQEAARTAGLDGRAVVHTQSDLPVIAQRTADVSLTHEKLSIAPLAAVLPVDGGLPAMGLLETISHLPPACTGWHGQGSICSLRGPPSGGMVTPLFA